MDIASALPEVDLSLEELIEQKKKESNVGTGGKAGRMPPPPPPRGGRGGRAGGYGFRGGHPQNNRGGFAGPMMAANPMGMMNPMMMQHQQMMMNGMMQQGHQQGLAMQMQQPQHQHQQQLVPPNPSPQPGALQPKLQRSDEMKLKTQKFQTCVKDPSGDVIVRYKNHDIVCVKPTGEVHLRTVEGQNKAWVFSSLNDALHPIGVKVVLKTEGAYDGDWFVSDGGKFMKKFTEGMVLPTWMGAKVQNRGESVFNALNDEDRSLAVLAAAASSAQARKHGIDTKPAGGYALEKRKGTTYKPY